jgi:hypothetical protein
MRYRVLLVLSLQVLSDRLMHQQRKQGPALRLGWSVEPDRNAAAMMCPSIIKQFAEMLGQIAWARRGALDPTTQGFQFGHQVQQRPAARIPSDCWDGVSRSTTEVERALSLSARACTSADVNVIGSRLAMMRSFLVTLVRFRLRGLGTLQRPAQA